MNKNFLNSFELIKSYFSYKIKLPKKKKKRKTKILLLKLKEITKTKKKQLYFFNFLLELLNDIYMKKIMSRFN